MSNNDNNLAGKKETDGLTHLSVAKQNSLHSSFCDFFVFHVVLLQIFKVKSVIHGTAVIVHIIPLEGIHSLYYHSVVFVLSDVL